MTGGSYEQATQYIRTHRVTAFFINTLAISLGLGYTWILVVDKRMFLLAPLPVIARVGSALAGLMFVIARLFLLASLDKKMLITGQPSREIKWKTG